MLQVLTEFQLCKHGRHLSKWDNRKCFVDVWRSCVSCQKVTKEMNYWCVLVTPWRCTFSFTDSWYIKLTPWQANAMEAAMFVSYPTAPLCKTQHDWVTASQHPLRFQKCRSAFQNVMNTSTLSNALVNIREELWLADSDIPPLRKKCLGQAGLPGSLPPCAETLAGEDANWWFFVFLYLAVPTTFYSSFFSPAILSPFPYLPLSQW